MTNLVDYLMGKVVKKKKRKKPTRRRRTRWGQRMGKVANESNNRKDSKIEKLLDILIARSAPTNSIELARMKQIEGDFQLAQELQTQENMKSKSKKIDEEQPQPDIQPRIAENPITSVDRQHRFQAYQNEFNSLEEGYNSLLETLQDDIGESTVISGDAMSDFIVRKEQLNANRNVLRKDLLEDIKNNPSEVWEWRGFIEQSENETAQLLDLDNKVSQILYDQAMRNISEREALTEQQVAQAEANKTLMENQLIQNKLQQQKEREFTKKLEEQNEKITEQKLQLIKEATEKELKIEELDRTQKNFSDEIMKPFNQGRETVEQFLDNKISGGSNTFQRALGATNLDSTWDIYGKSGTEEKKRQLRIALAKRIEEKQKFLPKKVEGIMGALPRSPSLERAASGSSVSSVSSRGSLSPRRTVSGDRLLNVMRATANVIDQSTRQEESTMAEQLTPATPFE